MAEIIQYSQSDNINNSDALLDSLTQKDTSNLDELQIRNIGIGLFGFSPISSTTGKLNTNIGFDRIAQSFKIILHTYFGEVPMLPILGSNLDNYLFEPLDDIWDNDVELAITQAITELEPRVEVMELNITHNEDENKAFIEIHYRLTNTNIVKVFRDTIVTSNGGDVL